jgi:large subunit ribosomal protein L4
MDETREQLIESLASRPIESFSVPIHAFQAPGEVVGTFELPEDVFSVPIRQDIVQTVIKWQRAKRRQPQKTKRYPEVRGSGRKPYKQKGTGKARVGQARAPHRRGGVKAHGPVLRSFYYPLNRKLRQLGLKVALAAKFREGNLFLVDALELQEPKTRLFADLMKEHGWMGGQKRVLLVGEGQRRADLDGNLDRGYKNVENVHLLPSQGANVYDIVKADYLVLSHEGLMQLVERICRP